MKDKQTKAQKISVYLTAENAEKMALAKQQRGMNTTQFINHCCEKTYILAVGNNIDLAKAYCRLVMLIDDETKDEELREEVKCLCQYMCDLLRVVESRDCFGK